MSRQGGEGEGEARWLAGETGAAERTIRRALDDAHLRGPDDVTLRRMWGRVADGDLRRRHAPPRWLWFASGVACTAALAFAFAAWLWPRPPRGPVVPAATVAAQAVSAPALAASASGPTALPSTVAGPAIVRAPAREPLYMTLQGGIEARLGPSSVMSIDADERPSVETGDIGFTVPHQSPGHSFVVQAGPYRVIVVGTKFSLRVGDRRQVLVSVDEGVVEVWGGHDRVAVLSPGQSWASPSVISADDSGAAVAPPERAGSAAAHSRPGRAVALARPGAGEAAPSPAAGAPAEAPGTGARAGENDLAAQARASLAAGDPARALSLYRTLAQRGGPAAENAAYEIGKVLRDRMAQPAEAVVAWRRYRSEHPDGILRVETDVSIIETLVHSGDSAAALSEAEDFLRRHPDSERRAEIARLAGDLHRAGGDCRRAVTAYQTALASSRAKEIAEAATFHRAACLIELHDPTGAAAVQAYLRLWPAGRFHVEAAALLEQVRAADPAAAAAASAARR
jgi:hypothetical protein